MLNQLPKVKRSFLLSLDKAPDQGLVFFHGVVVCWPAGIWPVATHRMRNGSAFEMSISVERIYFKKCSNCGFKWRSRDCFLADSNLQIIGYQANFKELATGLLYFNHSCKGTLAIQAYLFGDLYDGPIFEQRATGGDACPSYCLHREELQLCPAECECAYVREIVQIIKDWPKR